MWIKNWQLGVHEQVLHNLEPGLGCPRTIRMSTHAVKYEHQGRVLGNDDSGTVLIVRAVTQCRDFGVLDLHVFIAVY